jgi:hypothetical protein
MLSILIGIERIYFTKLATQAKSDTANLKSKFDTAAVQQAQIPSKSRGGRL